MCQTIYISANKIKRKKPMYHISAEYVKRHWGGCNWGHRAEIYALQAVLGMKGTGRDKIASAHICYTH